MNKSYLTNIKQALFFVADGGINWATLVDTKVKYLYKTARTISNQGLKNSNAQLLPVNTVIFSSRATIGEVTIAKVETATNQGYKNFVCDSRKFHYEYLYYILKREASNIEKIYSGMTYAEISKSEISDYKIPLPPLEIQKQIVAEMKAIEQQAARDTEEIERLKHDIEKQVAELDTGNYPSEKIGTHFKINHLSCDPAKMFGDAPFVYIDIESIINGTGEIAAGKSVIGNKAPSRARRRAESGSLLLSTVRPNLKGFAYIDSVPETFVFSTVLAILKSNDEAAFSTKLLYYLSMFSPLLMAQMTAKMPKSGYPSINLDDIKALMIPVPLSKDQTRIVSELDTREQRIRELKAAIAAAEGKKGAILEKHLS